MNDAAPNRTIRRSWIVAFVLAAAVAAGLVIFLRSSPDLTNAADEETTAAFFVALAALDVEENERAQRVLGQLVAGHPEEPALWANLAVAQLRLNDRVAAANSLDHALSLAPESGALLLLKAQVLESSGQISAAIDVLRDLHHRWPENIRVAFQLNTLLGQVNSGDADRERLALLTAVLDESPRNLRVLCECARLAATSGDEAVLLQNLETLQAMEDRGSQAMQDQLQGVLQAVREKDFRQVAVLLTFFENLSKPTRGYQLGLDELGILSVTAVGTPVRSFLALAFPPVEAAPPDSNLTFEWKTDFGKAARPEFVLAVEQTGERCSTLLSLSGNTLHVDDSAALPFPGFDDDGGNHSLAWADLNSDFRSDLILAGRQGCQIRLASETDSYEPIETNLDLFQNPWKSVWCSDFDADGDLDVLLSDQQSMLQCVRNDGNQSYSQTDAFSDFEAVVQFVELDFDLDGDLDVATLDRDGRLAIGENLREGAFQRIETPTDEPLTAIAVGDLNLDGRFEVVATSRRGSVEVISFDGERWGQRSVLDRDLVADRGARLADNFLSIADLDNNGAVDLVSCESEELQIWLQGPPGDWSPLRNLPGFRVTSVLDYDCDGRLDLAGFSGESPVVAINQSRAGYRWHTIQPRATLAAGDKRFNSFGIGGTIEIRAGNLVQSQAIRSSRVHFGIGNQSEIDVARIVWPNGTSQAEFGLHDGDVSTAEQRLKGSCPWVFAYDGDEFRFVKDFLWRSPLGLKINAQDTAGVMQTEDRIKIAGESLKQRDGRYDIRITAELWETHFFDHVSLLLVDHPGDTEIYVDECFAPQRMPHEEIFVGSKSHPLSAVRDQDGNSMDEVLRDVDGRFADRFSLGPFQGVTDDHWIEFEFPDSVSRGGEFLLVGHGWIYPTDSSLNVAIAQHGEISPRGLVLERQTDDGRWEMIRDQIGFPAGKHKDVILALREDEVSSSVRYRLRTNMEVYWDSLRWSNRSADSTIKTAKIPLSEAELCYRGFSKLEPIERRRPDTPVYEVERREALWMDLEGFHTRHGDVKPLLEVVDDRYIIMNAGDEIRLSFSARDGDADPLPDHKRDFILIGDGWVKDGDFNTAFSRTVRPLPSHASPDYSGPLTALERDPVFQRHASDWRTYHTRYVSPKTFHQKLRRRDDSSSLSFQE